MRLTTLLPRLTAPKVILTDALPTFMQTCRPVGSILQPQARTEEKNKTDSYEDAAVPFSNIREEVPLSQLFDASALPRAIFLGEQHHQPKVLSAQLQILSHIFGIVREPDRVHVVLEHWSLADQVMLNERFNTRDPDALAAHSEEETSEGFSAGHYITIVKLVRELGGTVWGGFPPRSWAKLVSKADECAFPEVQRLDQARFSANREAETQWSEDLIPPLAITDYDLIEEISWSHRTYLKSMFRPDQRPEMLADPRKGKPPRERRGFLAAQTLKDTYLAHAMASILTKDPRRFVVAVTGVGHCEWGFGAPDRLCRMIAGVEPFVVITKPEDGGYWAADPYMGMENNEQESATHVEEECGRKQANAIVLYEWVD